MFHRDIYIHKHKEHFRKNFYVLGLVLFESVMIEKYCMFQMLSLYCLVCLIFSDVCNIGIYNIAIVIVIKKRFLHYFVELYVVEFHLLFKFRY